MISVAINGEMPAVNGFSTVFTIPEGYRPVQNMMTNFITRSGEPMAMSISTNGGVSLFNNYTAINGIICQITFTWINGQ